MLVHIGQVFFIIVHEHKSGKYNLTATITCCSSGDVDWTAEPTSDLRTPQTTVHQRTTLRNFLSYTQPEDYEHKTMRMSQEVKGGFTVIQKHGPWCHHSKSHRLFYKCSSYLPTRVFRLVDRETGNLASTEINLHQTWIKRLVQVILRQKLKFRNQIWHHVESTKIIQETKNLFQE